MVELAVKRILLIPVLLIVASFVIFSMVYLAPGSPEATLLGGKQATPQAYERVREEYKLDEPVLRPVHELARAASSPATSAIRSRCRTPRRT